MSITVSGSSDDLIEVDGNISQEFGAYESGRYLGFSNGVILRVMYDDNGIWRVTPIAGRDKVSIVYCSADTDDGACSDVATLTEPATWVVCGTEWAGVR